MVEEPGGDKLEERGVRGERRASGVSRRWVQKVTWRISTFFVFLEENKWFWIIKGPRWETIFHACLGSYTEENGLCCRSDTSIWLTCVLSDESDAHVWVFFVEGYI